MIHSPVVTFRQMNSAVSAVQDELYSLGLWNEDSRLPLTTVFWCRLPQPVYRAEGFFVYDEGMWNPLLGYEVGNIYIPKLVLSHDFWRNRRSLRDVVRHEYAHAIEYHYPVLAFHSKKFKTAFPAPYPQNYEKTNPWHVSDYAAKAQTEDFAETFMVYVRHSGKLPNYLNTPHIKRKWRFISELCEAIDSGASKW